MSGAPSLIGPIPPEELADIRHAIETAPPPPKLRPTPHFDGREVIEPDYHAEPTPTSPERLRAIELGAFRLDEVKPVEPEPLLVGRLAPHGHTILFGDGDVGKGTLACQWFKDLVEEGHTVLVLDYEDHRDEWTWRLDGLGGPEVRSHVWHVAPAARGWKGPIWEHTDRILELADTVEAGVIVVDSVAIASVGYETKDDQTASHYATAVQRIGGAVLSIAHVTKAGISKWPYGSVFWHNLARVTWNLAEIKDGRLLSCRKSNAYRKPPKQLVSITWDGTRLREVWQKPYAEHIQSEVLDILAESGSLTRTQIVSALREARDGDEEPVNANSVKQVLIRAKRQGLVVLEGGDKWSRTR